MDPYETWYVYDCKGGKNNVTDTDGKEALRIPVFQSEKLRDDRHSQSECGL